MSNWDMLQALVLVPTFWYLDLGDLGQGYIGLMCEQGRQMVGIGWLVGMRKVCSQRSCHA